MTYDGQREAPLGVSQMRVQSYNIFLKSPNRVNLLITNMLSDWHAFCCFWTLA